jgi:hypothetical protein
VAASGRTPTSDTLGPAKSYILHTGGEGERPDDRSHFFFSAPEVLLASRCAFLRSLFGMRGSLLFGHSAILWPKPPQWLHCGPGPEAGRRLEAGATERSWVSIICM